MILRSQFGMAVRASMACFSAMLCLLATGCARVSYTPPSARLSETGPSIAVLPACDGRVVKQGGRNLPLEVQQAIAAELSSMGRFSKVVTVSNVPTEKMDYTLSSEIHLLEAGAPSAFTGRRSMMETAIGGVVGAGIVESIAAVHGYAAMSFKLRSVSGAEVTFFYPDVISTNRSSNGGPGGGTKGEMMTLALKATMLQLKLDLEKELVTTASAKQR